MQKQDVIWYEEVYTRVMEEDGWWINLVANHFKYKFWYEIEMPDGTFLDFMTKDIYEAIDKLHELKEKYNKNNLSGG